MATDDLFSGVLPFLHVAEQRSFRQAAARLGVSAAAVSKAVLRLEASLGVKLLARTSRSVALTPEGEAFLVRCREAVTAMQSGREQVSESRRQPRGEVHVTLSPILAPRVVAHSAALLARHPKLTLRLQVTDRVVRLAEEGVDVAVRLGPIPESSLVAKPLRRTRWVTLASPSYVARHGVPAHPSDLERLDCVRFVAPDGRPREWSFVEPSTGVALTPRVRGRLLVDQGERLLDAARAGAGVCQVLDFMIGAEVREGGLVEVLGSYAAEGPPITALAAPERARSPNVRAIFAFLSEVLRTS